MNKNDARKIAETITNDQLVQMFSRAKSEITDWEKVSSVNKGMTKGATWNILAANFDPSKTCHVLAKQNMVWEFGDFLPDELKIKKAVRVTPIPVHQDPNFVDGIKDTIDFDEPTDRREMTREDEFQHEKSQQGWGDDRDEEIWNQHFR